MNKTWWDYVQSITKNATNTEIADRVGIDKSAITRWRRGAGVDPLFAVKFARAFGRPVVEALHMSGLITEAEADLRIVHVGADELSNVDLVNEVARRLDVTDAAFTAPDDVEDDFVEDTRPTHIRAVEDLDSLPYVAGTDDSEEELDRD